MLLAGPAVRSAIACALCALALSSSPQLAISAEATPDARAALPYVSDTKVSIQPAAHPSRTGPFYQASVKEVSARPVIGVGPVAHAKAFCP